MIAKTMLSTTMITKWWVVALPCESGMPDLFGPYLSEDAAAEAAERWNDEHDAGYADMAEVVPVVAGRVREL